MKFLGKFVKRLFWNYCRNFCDGFGKNSFKDTLQDFFFQEFFKVFSGKLFKIFLPTFFQMQNFLDWLYRRSSRNLFILSNIPPVFFRLFLERCKKFSRGFYGYSFRNFFSDSYRNLVFFFRQFLHEFLYGSFQGFLRGSPWAFLQKFRNFQVIFQEVRSWDSPEILEIFLHRLQHKLFLGFI